MGILCRVLSSVYLPISSIFQIPYLDYCSALSLPWTLGRDYLRYFSSRYTNSKGPDCALNSVCFPSRVCTCLGSTHTRLDEIAHSSTFHCPRPQLPELPLANPRGNKTSATGLGTRQGIFIPLAAPTSDFGLRSDCRLFAYCSPFVSFTTPFFPQFLRASLTFRFAMFPRESRLGPRSLMSVLLANAIASTRLVSSEIKVTPLNDQLRGVSAAKTALQLSRKRRTIHCPSFNARHWPYRDSIDAMTLASPSSVLDFC